MQIGFRVFRMNNILPRLWRSWYTGSTRRHFYLAFVARLKKKVDGLNVTTFHDVNLSNKCDNNESDTHTHIDTYNVCILIIYLLELVLSTFDLPFVGKGFCFFFFFFFFLSSFFLKKNNNNNKSLIVVLMHVSHVKKSYYELRSSLILCHLVFLKSHWSNIDVSVNLIFYSSFFVEKNLSCFFKIQPPG